MELPNPHLARIDREKLTDYLLNPEHPGNGGKAGFFLSMGFGTRDWMELASALRRAVRTGRVAGIADSPHGRKYILDGCLDAPAGARRGVRMVWILETDRSAPRLVTVYPEKGACDDTGA